MQKQITIHTKHLNIQLSQNAVRQSQALTSRLIVEIQVYFSCLLGKRLVFYSEQPVEGTWLLEADEFENIFDEAQQISDNLYLRFNTVMTKSCPVSDYIGPPPVSDFKIRNQKPYVPDWLSIDYNDNLWSGQYGWKSSDQHFKNTKQVRSQAISTKK